MGTHGIRVMNENGERFKELCAQNNLIIGGIIFPYKRIHKALYTWISPDHTTENQIDHIYINKKFRRTLQDVRVKRGADAASDHHLVLATLKLKLKANRTQEANRRQKYNVNLLKNMEMREDFKLELSNKFHALQDLCEDETESHDQYQIIIKDSITATCEKVVGNRRQQKEWITPETMKEVQHRRNKKKQK